MNKETRLKLNKSINNYFESKAHIVDGKILKERKDVVRGVTNNVLKEQYKYTDEQIKNANDYVDKTIPKTKQYNKKTMVIKSLIPAGIATTLGAIVATKNPESGNFIMQNTDSIIMFGLGALSVSSLYQLKAYSLKRKPLFTSETKEAKTAYVLEANVDAALSEMETKGKVKAYGYGR